MLAVGIAGGTAANVYVYNGADLLKPSRSLNQIKEPISLRLDATQTNTAVEYRAQAQIRSILSDASQQTYVSQNSIFNQLATLEIEETDADTAALALLEEEDTETLSEEEGMLITSSDEKLDEETSVEPYANADTSEVESILSFGLTSEQTVFRSEAVALAASEADSGEEE
ncbi:MAG: hypothetical protein ACOY3I_08335 [Verrucomicrobiota bacterium]